MTNYKKIYVSSIDNKIIDETYKNLLENKWHFVILDVNGVLNVLTKEKSLFNINNEQQFINDFKQDIYYKTIIINKNISINENDLNIYNAYIQKYKDIMGKNIYGDKYVFGSVAVKTDKGFITTIRGKENLNDYTLVNSVDHTNHTLNVENKKATLNAPLLDYLFKNEKVKVIVHINHEYDNNLPYYDYAFPGTVRDSIRNNKTSFNIKYHGVIYLFDKNGNLIYGRNEK
ncbi:MAG TPA: hypothetical protein IAB40_05400 [Candidatus Onthocola stercoravium]|nr:hypothetical protein [Candidatus Onthocola stercoravium]